MSYLKNEKVCQDLKTFSCSEKFIDVDNAYGV